MGIWNHLGNDNMLVDDVVLILLRILDDSTNELTSFTSQRHNNDYYNELLKEKLCSIDYRDRYREEEVNKFLDLYEFPSGEYVRKKHINAYIRLTW
jgi:hypothetical protein